MVDHKILTKYPFRYSNFVVHVLAANELDAICVLLKLSMMLCRRVCSILHFSSSIGLAKLKKYARWVLRKLYENRENIHPRSCLYGIPTLHT